jgi:tetratricopeptide (TPR) repeat protein
MKPFLSGLAAVLALGAAVVPFAHADGVKVELKTVSGAFDAADHRKVIDLAGTFPTDHPDSAKVLYLAGESRLVLGEAAEAETAFRAVVAAKPKAVPALVGLGRAVSLQGKHEEAEKTLRSAVALDAKDAAAQRTLGEALLAAGKAEEGTKALEQAAKTAPNDPFTARALVEARLRADDVKGAKAIAEKLAKAAPKHPMGDFLVGLALDREEKHADAIEAYEKALAKDDRFLDAHKNLAILCHAQSNTYQDQVRVKKAFDHYERYFALGGADAKLKQMYDTMKAYFEQQGK